MFRIVTNRNRRSFDFLENIQVYNIENRRTSFNKKDHILFYFESKYNKTPLSRIQIPKGGKTIGSIEGVNICRNKSFLRKTLIQGGISSPKTWFDINKAEVPFIARPKYHHMGKDFYCIRSEREKQEFISKNIAKEGWYFSKIINIKNEWRVILFNFEVLFAYKFPVYDTPEDTVRIRLENRNLNAEHEIVELSQEQKALAKRAMKLIDLGFGGLDLIEDFEGNYYIGEINNSPTLYPKLKEELKKAIDKYQEEVEKEKEYIKQNSKRNIFWVTKTTKNIDFLDGVVDIIKPDEIHKIQKNDIAMLYPWSLWEKIPKLENIFNTNLNAIVTAGQKQKCREKLQESGISVPKTWRVESEAIPPYIVRPFSHSEGKNFKIIETRKEQKNRIKFTNKQKEYYSEVINFKEEHRVIIIQGKIILSYNRHIYSNVLKTIEERNFIRLNNFTFFREETAHLLTEEQKNICIESMKIIGLEFGGIDLGIDSKGKPYIIEINTTPHMHGTIVKQAIRDYFLKLRLEEDQVDYDYAPFWV